jgi:hypothetical protein
MTDKASKPLGFKNYGSIGHLPCSRMGPGDHSVHAGQADICTKKARDRHDRIWVTEKLDGSNVGVAMHGGEFLALGRAGYLASTSKFEQHQLFAAWVRVNEERFRCLLDEGERCVGEWLAQAHGTTYALRHEPFVIFDLMRGQERLPWEFASERIANAGFVAPYLLNDGCSPLSVEEAIYRAEAANHHGADCIEGAVWRVERHGEFDFMAKYVKPTKVDGALLPEMNGGEAVWNWKPGAVTEAKQ